MRELRWLLLRVAPLFAALVVAVGLAGASPRASALAGDCAVAGTLLAATQASPAGAFVISPLLDDSGTLAGQRVELGTARRATLRLDLPPESFAAGPFGRVIVVGSDDGRRSTLRAFDVTSGCAWSLATEPDVIRRATIDVSGGDVYEVRVDRATRADGGVWRRPIGGGTPTRALGPLPADDRYGPTSSTELAWSAEGDVLVAQSCGMTQCRTRLLDIATASVRTLETPDQGEAIGLAEGRMITYAACRGLPCPVAALDIRTGDARILVPEARAARIVSTAAGPRLLAEVGADENHALVLVDPASAVSDPVPANILDWLLVPPPGRADGAVAIPPGWALLTRDGRAPAPGGAATVVGVADGSTRDLTEVTR